MVKQEVSGKLLPAVRNEVLLLLGGVDAAGKRPVPHAGILVRIDKEKAPEVLEAAGKLFSYLLGEEVKQRVLRQMSDHAIFVPSGDQAFSPSFSVVGDWLVACTSEQMLRKIVATSLGQEPGIADLPGFTEKVAGARPYFFLSYLDCGVFSEDLKNYFRSVTGLGDRFDPAAVEETVAPLLDALGKAGRIGGAVIQRGAGVTGSVVPL